MRRNIKRIYNLPPGEQENADAFFVRMDELNAAGQLEQDALDEEFMELLIGRSFASYLRRETDPDYILYNT